MDVKTQNPTSLLEVARANSVKIDWQNYQPPVPRFLGVKEVKASIETLRHYIDWTPFFMTWSLAGKYPRILEDEVVGEEARKLLKDANNMLDQLAKDNALTPRGIFGLFPANSVGDDIEIYRSSARDSADVIALNLRQQTEKKEFPNYCLSDFVAPKASGKADYIGAFAVTGVRRRCPCRWI